MDILANPMMMWQARSKTTWLHHLFVAKSPDTQRQPIENLVCASHHLHPVPLPSPALRLHRRAIRPGPAKRLDEITTLVWRQTLQRYRPSGGVADEALKRIAAMSGNLGVGVQGKAMHAGATRTAQGGALTFVTKARSNPTDSLTKPDQTGRNDGRLEGARGVRSGQR